MSILFVITYILKLQKFLEKIKGLVLQIFMSLVSFI